MFMISNTNQLQLISIADNKANVITILSSSIVFLIIILFTVATVLPGSNFLDEPKIVLPLGNLLILCTLSTICSILALKPKIIRSRDKNSKSALFFSNYYRKTIEEYKKDMYQVMDNNQSIYDQMLTDKYYNGLVLERKYALLGYAYTIFLIAIIMSMTSYIIALLL